MVSSFHFLLWLASGAVSLLQTREKTAFNLSALSLYAPYHSPCPASRLVRPAYGLSPGEKDYIDGRERRTRRVLKNWLEDQLKEKHFEEQKLPRIALAISGGSMRSFLLGAGIIQAFDTRDSDDATNGLYQSLAYISGLSGGAWLVAALAGNDFSTISSLTEDAWYDAFPKHGLWPDNYPNLTYMPMVVRDLSAKNSAGFTPTVTDAWGRIMAYQLLRRSVGGASLRMSSLAYSPSFRLRIPPYPIITAVGVNDINQVCDPADDALQYEFTMHEFGSWDKGVNAFTPMSTIGTSMSGGRPATWGRCVQNYDSFGYIIGTSSSKFNEQCGTSVMSAIREPLEPYLPRKSVESGRRKLFAPFPNPFYKYPGSLAVQNQPELKLVDGGSTNQNNPVWPLLWPAREIDVVIVNDNSADTEDNFPNGTELLHTYVQAQAAGLTRMPFIPPVAEFVDKRLHKRATFFGCYEPRKSAIIYLPNVNYTYESNIQSLQLQYEKPEIDGMIGNGVQIAIQGGDLQWPKCLACGIMMKSTWRLPSSCKSCLQKYCYQREQRQGREH